MSSEISGSIRALLESLGGTSYIRLNEGLLYTKIKDVFFETMDETDHDRTSDAECDILVSITGNDDGVVLTCHLDADESEREQLLHLSDFGAHELLELSQHLATLLTESHTSATPQAVILRKRPAFGMYDIHQAAQKLNISETLLKYTVPCTDYTYKEENGKKEMYDFVWSDQLIEKLATIPTGNFSKENLQYLAETCCHGDVVWAEEIVASLKNRKKQTLPTDKTAPATTHTPPATGGTPKQTEQRRPRSRRHPKKA